MPATSSGTQTLASATNLPSTGTFCCWAKGTSNNGGAVAILESTGSSIVFEFNADTTNWVMGATPIADVDLGVVFSVWVFLAVSFQNNTASGGNVYVRQQSQRSLTLVSTWTTANVTPDNFALFNDGATGLSGSIAFAKLWDRVLTKRELEIESYCGEPVSRGNLNRFHPLNTGTAALGDWSPNARNFTLTGTLADGGANPVPLRKPIQPAMLVLT